MQNPVKHTQLSPLLIISTQTSQKQPSPAIKLGRIYTDKKLKRQYDKLKQQLWALRYSPIL